jgi:outer membrane immunogenic protein
LLRSPHTAAPARPAATAAPIYSPVLAYNWSGASIGIIGGGALGKSGQTYTDGSFTTGEYKVTGGLLGLHAQLDYQTGPWVWGLGGDLLWSSVRGSAVGAPLGASATFSTELTWLYTGYFRFGYAFDRFFPYAMTGPAFGGVKVGGTIPGLGAVSNSSVWLGWGVGLGFAYAITPNLTARADYTYVCLGESIQFSVDTAEYMNHLVRVGLDYKFGWLPPQGAADPMLAKAPAMGAIYNWTGFYVGFNLGGLTGRVNTEYTLGGTAPFVGLHAMTGAQAGYNRQVGNYVFGFESDLEVSFQSSDWQFQARSGGVTATIDTEQKVPLFWTLRGRAGYAADRLLFYGTGGLAYGELESDVTVTVSGLGSIKPRFEKSRAGWTVGAGVEGALWRGWTAKFEYMYVDFGSIGESFAGIGPFATIATSTTVHDHSLRVGLNNSFN